MGTVFNRILRWSHGYRHFNSHVDEFYREYGKYKIASVNNHKLDCERLGDFRISRFVRDPRDLIVSGYFYHRRGAEQWCNIVGPRDQDWSIINGNIPRSIGANDSFSTYLQNLSQEDGLIAEIEFRNNHFQSMLEWPLQDSRIRTFRYEDVIDNEEAVFRQILEFYELPWLDRRLGVLFAGKYAARRRHKPTRHIRNPKPGQWREYFTPKVNDHFNHTYKNLLQRLGYE